MIRVVLALFCLGAGVFLAVSLYRLLWRCRQQTVAGLVRRPARVAGSGVGWTRSRPSASLELLCELGTVRVDPTAVHIAGRSLQTGERVTLECVEAAGSFQVVRIRPGIWPELRWLRWPRMAAIVLCVTALLVGQQGPAIGSIPVQVQRTHRAACTARGQTTSISQLRALQRRIRPLHRKMGKVQLGDWLSQHREPGQTFEQYLRADPVRIAGQRRAIYVQPIGSFGGKGSPVGRVGGANNRRRVLDLTVDFMSRYFCLEVRVARPLPLSLVPAHARRRHPTWGMRQILSPYVLDHLLKPRLPPQAAAYIGFTTSDLWPGPGWNFVFGQASLRDRVGVWSIHRNGDVDGGREAFNLALLRTIKTAVHETGHMFSMHHCTAYECNMCGSNSQIESDRRPIPLCPECLAKLVWASGCDPRARYRDLQAFFAARGMAPQQQAYARLASAVGGD